MNEIMDKQMRLVGKLMAVEAALKEAHGDVLPSDKRSRELMEIALTTIQKAVLSVWDQAA